MAEQETSLVEQLAKRAVTVAAGGDKPPAGLPSAAMAYEQGIAVGARFKSNDGKIYVLRGPRWGLHYTVNRSRAK